MKGIEVTVRSRVHRRRNGRTSFPFYVLLVVICAATFAASSEANKRAQSEDEARRTKDKWRVSNSNEVHRLPSNNEEETNDSALHAFLRNILKAQDELKWIDESTRNVDYRDRSSELQVARRSRGKRSLDQTLTKKMSENLADGIYWRGDVDYEELLDDRLSRRNRRNRDANRKATTRHRHWKDLSDANDYWNGQRSEETGDYGALRENSNAAEEPTMEKDRNVEIAPSLQSLKEAVLELKKNLSAEENSLRQDKRGESTAAIKGYDDSEKEAAQEEAQEEENEIAPNKKNDYDQNPQRMITSDSHSEQKREIGESAYGESKSPEQSTDLRSYNWESWRRIARHVGKGVRTRIPQFYRRRKDSSKASHQRRRRTRGSVTGEKMFSPQNVQATQNTEKFESKSVCERNNCTAAANLSTSCSRPNDDEKKLCTCIDSATNATKEEDAIDIADNNPNKCENREVNNAKTRENVDTSISRIDLSNSSAVNEWQNGASKILPNIPKLKKMTEHKERGGRGEEGGEERESIENKSEGIANTPYEQQMIKVSEPTGNSYGSITDLKEIIRVEPYDGQEEPRKQEPSEKRRKAEVSLVNIAPPRAGNFSLLTEDKQLNSRTNQSNGANSTAMVAEIYNLEKKVITQKEEKSGELVSAMVDVKLQTAQLNKPKISQDTSQREQLKGCKARVNLSIDDLKKFSQRDNSTNNLSGKMTVKMRQNTNEEEDLKDNLQRLLNNEAFHSNNKISKSNLEKFDKRYRDAAAENDSSFSKLLARFNENNENKRKKSLVSNSLVTSRDANAINNRHDSMDHYWGANNYKEVSDAGDLMALRANTLDYGKRQRYSEKGNSRLEKGLVIDTENDVQNFDFIRENTPTVDHSKLTNDLEEEAETAEDAVEGEEEEEQEQEEQEEEEEPGRAGARNTIQQNVELRKTNRRLLQIQKEKLKASNSNNKSVVDSRKRSTSQAKIDKVANDNELKKKEREKVKGSTADREYEEQSNENEDSSDVDFEDSVESESDTLEDEKEENEVVPLGDYEVEAMGKADDRDNERDPYIARVNMLIKHRINSKRRKNKNNSNMDNHARKKRHPLSVIEYYDYDEANERVESIPAMARSNDGSNDEQAVDSLQSRLKFDLTNTSRPSSAQCNKTNNSSDDKIVGPKKSEEEEELIKQEKKKAQLGNKQPKEQFIVGADVSQAKNETNKSSKKGQSDDEERFSDEMTKETRDGDSGVRSNSNKWSYGNGGSSQLNGEKRQPMEKEAFDNDISEKIILNEPLEYILHVPERLEKQVVDVVFGDTQPVDLLQHEKRINDPKDSSINDESWRDENHYEQRADPVRYDDDELESELKKLSDCNDNELKNKVRLKGDRRMYYESDQNMEKNDFQPELLNSKSPGREDWSPGKQTRERLEEVDHFDPTNVHHEDKSILRNNEILDDTLSRSGDVDARNSVAAIPLAYMNSDMKNAAIDATDVSGSPRPTAINTSGSNYTALKNTDDLFKGGVEQSDIHNDKFPNSTTLGKNQSEWRVIPVVNAPNDVNSDIRLAYELFNAQRQKNSIESDSASPYETGRYLKYAESAESSEVLDKDKESALESKDLHESFVEPLDCIDDFDNDIKMRLGRGLKALDDFHASAKGSQAESIENNKTRHSLSENATRNTKRDTEIDGKVAEKNDYVGINRNVSKNNGTANGSESSSTLEKSSTDDYYQKSGGIIEVKEKERSPALYDASLNKTSSIERFNEGDASRDKERSKSAAFIGSANPERDSNYSLKDGDAIDEAVSLISRSTLEPIKKNSSRVKRDGNSVRSSYNEVESPYNSYPNGGKVYEHFRPAALSLFHADLENSDSRADERKESDYETSNFDVDNEEKIYDEMSKKSDLTKRMKSSDRRKKKAKRKLKKKKKKARESSRKPTKELERRKFGSIVDDRLRHRKRRNHKDHSTLRKRKRDKVKKQSALGKKSSNNSLEKNTRLTENRKRLGNSYREGARNAPIYEENAEDQGIMKGDEGARKKKLEMLLTADNMEDESQMDIALHGELAGKIVENIFEQVRKNEALKVALGPGLYRTHKPADAAEMNKSYRQSLDQEEAKHTEEMMKNVMNLLGRLVLDEVHRKTCATLPPDMQEYLQWMLGVEPDEHMQEQAFPLPFVHNVDVPNRHPNKFLFSLSSDRTNLDINMLYKKVRILKNLINEYGALSLEEKVRVQSVYDYLAKEVNTVLNMIEIIEKKVYGNDKTNGETSHTKSSNFLDYQNQATNYNKNKANTSVTNATANHGTNLPSPWKLNNVTFAIGAEEIVDDTGSAAASLHTKRREIRSLDKKHRSRKRKGREHKRHKIKHLKRHRQKHGFNQTPKYRNFVNRAATMQRKRGSILEDDWEPFNSGYEEPRVRKSVEAFNNFEGKIGNSYEQLDFPLSQTNRANERLKENILTPRKKKRDTSSNNSLQASDALPIKGKDRLEDELLLLNKREIWKRENEQQLEEVAFGKDMRNKTQEEEQFERLTQIDKRNRSNGTTLREKREGSKQLLDEELESSVRNRSHLTSDKNISYTFVSQISPRNVENFTTDLSPEEKLKLMERKINVFPDSSKISHSLEFLRNTTKNEDNIRQQNYYEVEGNRNLKPRRRKKKKEEEENEDEEEEEEQEVEEEDTNIEAAENEGRMLVVNAKNPDDEYEINARNSLGTHGLSNVSENMQERGRVPRDANHRTVKGVSLGFDSPLLVNLNTL